MGVAVHEIGLPRDQCCWFVPPLQIQCFLHLGCFLMPLYLISNQGIKAVIAKSFERIHRSNLVGMGVIPLCFKPGEDAESLGLTGHERYTIDLPSSVSDMRPGQDIIVVTDTGKSFTCTARFDTEVKFNISMVSREKLLP